MWPSLAQRPSSKPPYFVLHSHHSSHTLTHTYTATRKHAHTIHTNTNTQPLLIYSTHSIVHALFFPKINAVSVNSPSTRLNLELFVSCFPKQAQPPIYACCPLGPGTQRAPTSATAPPTGSTKSPRRLVSAVSPCLCYAGLCSSLFTSPYMYCDHTYCTVFFSHNNSNINYCYSK